MDRKQAQWWVAFSLDPSARPPQPQGALSAGWADVSPIFKPTAKGVDALCLFTTDYGATAYMQALGAQQGGAHPIITEGLTSRQDLERIAERFDVRYVVVNPLPAEEASTPTLASGTGFFEEDRADHYDAEASRFGKK